VSDPKRQDIGPNDPLYYVPRRLRERSNDPDPVPPAPAKDNEDRPARKPDENIAHLRPVGGLDSPVQKQPDIFAEAVEKALQEQAEPEPVEGPSAIDPEPLEPAKDNEEWSAQHKPDENSAHLRPAGGRDSRAQKQKDVFAEAVAKARQSQLEPEFLETPALLRNRQSFDLAAKIATAAGSAALVALIFAFASPSSQGPAETEASSTQSTSQSLKSSLSPAPQRKPAPTLVVRDSSGPVNEPLLLGVSVNSPDPGATVIIDGMPATARLTVGRLMSTAEWRVPAQEIWGASIIPPADFVGVMKLTAELRSADGDALVSSVVRLTWTSARPDSTVAPSADTAAVPSGPVAPTSQRQQPIASLTPSAAAPAAPPTPAEPIRAMTPNEVEGLLKRAQEHLAISDLQAGRLLLLRAAEAHDARAALALAKTFDPIVLKQFDAAEADSAKARSWYQRAKEWGAPEAQRQLDALAGYAR
jgi:hypothetical protein